jgi:hypothetical protein
MDCSKTGSGDIGALQSFIGKRFRNTAGTAPGFDCPAVPTSWVSRRKNQQSFNNKTPGLNGSIGE